VETRGIYQNKKREWYLGRAGREREQHGKPFYLNLWGDLETIDLIQSEEFAHWERKAGRIHYKFRNRISSKEDTLPITTSTVVGTTQGHSTENSTEDMWKRNSNLASS
jgi:hypothetical protein